MNIAKLKTEIKIHSLESYKSYSSHIKPTKTLASPIV